MFSVQCLIIGLSATPYDIKIPAVGKVSYGRDLFLHLYSPHSRFKGHAARDEFMEWEYSIVRDK